MTGGSCCGTPRCPSTHLASPARETHERKERKYSTPISRYCCFSVFHYTPPISLCITVPSNKVGFCEGTVVEFSHSPHKPSPLHLKQEPFGTSTSKGKSTPWPLHGVSHIGHKRCSVRQGFHPNGESADCLECPSSRFLPQKPRSDA